MGSMKVVAVCIGLLACSCGRVAETQDDLRADTGAGGSQASTGGAPNAAGGAPSDGGSGGVPAPTSDWTMLGYDVESTYWNRAETKISRSTVGGLEPAWEFDTGGNVTGTPAVVGDRAFFMSGTTGLYALDTGTGTPVWSRTGSIAIDLSAVDGAVVGSSSIAYDQGTIYAHANGDLLIALDATDGTLKWQYDTDLHPHCIGYSSPIVAGDLVLVGGSSAEEIIPLSALEDGMATFRGFVLAVNKHDGSMAWKRYTLDESASGAGVWSTVSVDAAAGLVFASTGNNHRLPATTTSDAFLAIPLASGGDFVWTTQMIEGDVWSSSSPVDGPGLDFAANPIVFDVGGRKLVAGGSTGGEAWVLDRMTGSVVARRALGPPAPGTGGIWANGAWDGQHLLFIANGATSEAPGSRPTEQDEEGTAVLFALDPLTLDIAWERQIGATVFSPITVANGVGFYGRGSALEAFDTSNGEILYELDVEGTIGSAPAISDGRVVFGAGITWFSGGAQQGTKVYMLEVP